MNESATQLERLPIFPLTGAILFPGVTTPLHIFEQRYVDMTRDALAGDRLIALVQPDRTRAPLEEGKPAVRPVVGVGRITRHEALPDGRYNIWLTGVGRARMVEELDTGTRYRIVRARWMPSEVGAEGEADAADTARKLLRALITAGDRTVAPLAVLLRDEVDTLLLSNALPSLLLTEVEAMQRMLEEPRVLTRLQTCVDELQERLLRQVGGDAN